MMDWAPFDGNSDLIQDNSLLGGDMATQYLIDDKGHTRIACIAGPLDKNPGAPASGRLSFRPWNAAGLADCLMAIASPAILNLTVDLKRCRNCWRKPQPAGGVYR